MIRTVKALLVAGVAAATLSGNAKAADVPIAPLAVAPIAGWYLAGFVGISNQQLGNLDNALFNTGGTVLFLDSGTFDAAPLFGLGVGYTFNEWFRADVTGEYRADSDFKGFDAYDFNNDGIWDGTNSYTGKKNEWLFLANAYVDLGTWNNLTPYVGAGIGASRNTIADFADYNAVTGTYASGATDSKWNLAWALHAGIGWHVTEAMTIDLGYRYVDLGDAQSGDLVTSTGVNAVYNPMIFDDLTSHDVVLGLRYSFM